ncbi:MAG TPA: sigma-70 family RNA polymerase sigma factor [Thermoanaerobaculia bacterium]|nr:sigma-70 family RNA polymerase sigma factor [Thermoanaerobaculia bacterium]
MTPEELFHAHRALVKRLAEQGCRRYHLSQEETEDFVSTVMLKLIADDYAVIRSHQGRSTLPTYLAVVVAHLLQDYLNHLWGKWRPSKEAQRRGQMAILLERLLVRDRKSLDEACQILLTNHKVELSRAELEELAAGLPPRLPPRRMEGEEGLHNLVARETADRRLVDEERYALLQKAKAALRRALEALPDQDQLIARMRGDDFSVVHIAKTLKLDQKPLYRRIEGICKTLRRALEAEGIRGADVDGVLGVDEPEDDEPEEPPVVH